MSLFCSGRSLQLCKLKQHLCRDAAAAPCGKTRRHFKRMSFAPITRLSVASLTSGAATSLQHHKEIHCKLNWSMTERSLIGDTHLWSQLPHMFCWWGRLRPVIPGLSPKWGWNPWAAWWFEATKFASKVEDSSTCTNASTKLCMDSCGFHQSCRGTIDASVVPSRTHEGPLMVHAKKNTNSSVLQFLHLCICHLHIQQIISCDSC